LLFATGWLLIGGLMLLLATPLDGIAERLAALRLEPGVRGSWPARALPYLAGTALAALSYRLSDERGWGCLPLAAAIIAFLWALSREVGRRRMPERLFFAERKGMTWAMVPFALTGAWVTGLIALAAYAGGSFFWAQNQVHRGRADQD
jgi:hypothetical protein